MDEAHGIYPSVDTRSHVIRFLMKCSFSEKNEVMKPHLDRYIYCYPEGYDRKPGSFPLWIRTDFGKRSIFFIGKNTGIRRI